MIGGIAILAILVIICLACVGYAFRHEDGSIACVMIIAAVLAFIGILCLVGEIRYQQGSRNPLPAESP